MSILYHSGDNESNPGRIFEYLIADNIQQLASLKHDIIEDVLYEDDLRKKYGWKSVGIDFLLVLRNQSENSRTLVAIQAKYRKTRRREDHAVSQFMQSLDFVANTTMIPIKCGLWVSRVKPFEDNIEKMQQKNIMCIYHFDCMTELVRRLSDMLVSII